MNARQVYVRSRRPHERAQALFRMGRIHEENGDIPQARRAYRHLLREFPRNKNLTPKARRVILTRPIIVNVCAVESSAKMRRIPKEDD